MATSQTIPLADFVKLTATTFLYNPPNHLPSSPTILLHTWMNASPSNIQFYVRKWRSLLPTARIFLSLGTVPNMVYVSSERQKRDLEIIISLLRAEPNSPLYAHLFSNAGAHSLCVLLRAFKETSTNKTTLLPLKGIIFDSTPSQWSYESGSAGMLYEAARFPVVFRLLAIAAIHVLLSIVVIQHVLFKTPNTISQLQADLNNESLVIRGVPRLYIYSEEDKLVKWNDVEFHAALAEKKGWPVQLEKFSGTNHCRHGKGEGEERYWNACNEMVVNN